MSVWIFPLKCLNKTGKWERKNSSPGDPILKAVSFYSFTHFGPQLQVVELMCPSLWQVAIIWLSKSPRDYEYTCWLVVIIYNNFNLSCPAIGTRCSLLNIYCLFTHYWKCFALHVSLINLNDVAFILLLYFFTQCV